MKQLKKLADYNSERARYYILRADREGNGLACPVCGEEMFDVNPHMILMGTPPKIRVGCLCGHFDYKII